ncbi:MAG TPA: hypothetical protein DDZ89_19000 [Clostridiales bacterium]|nr:hypothetical protein [Clostridiales bacterium]
MIDKDNVRWWEKEPLLMYEQNMATLPGISSGNDWQVHTDPKLEVDHIKSSNALQTHGLGFIDGHLTNRVCYFNSNKFKRIGRDYLGAYLEKSILAGYKTIVYFNTHAIKPDFGAEHPEWRQIRYDGSTIDDLYGIETTFCVNSSWRDWVRDVCLDLCKYPINGIFFDGPCIYPKACYCPNCRKLYMEQYGTQMPEKEPGNPELRKLAFFQADSMRRFMEYCNKAIKEIRPDVALYGNSGKRDEPYYVVGRNNRILMKDEDILLAEGGFVGGSLTTQPYWRQGSNAKYYHTQAAGKPVMVANSPAHSPWRSYYISEPELRLANVQPVIHGAGVWFSCFHWFKDQPAARALAKDYQYFSDNRDYYFITKSLAKVAIVWPEDSINYYSKPSVYHGDFTQGGQKGDKVGDIKEEFNGFYDALLKAHIPCDIIDEESVRSEDISKYELLILPNVGCTGAEFDERLRDYVANGGNVISSFETSMCDENGTRNTQPSLSDLFGIKMLRTPLKPYPHFYFFRQAEHSTFEDISIDRLPAPLISTEVEAVDAEVISYYSKKFKGWDGSEIVPSEYPAITVNHYGKGKAVYMAGVFGDLFWNYKQSDIRKILRNLFCMLSKRDIVVENMEHSVEMTYRQSNNGSMEMIHMINFSGGISRPFEKIIPNENIVLHIKTNRERARALVSGIELPVQIEKDGLTIKCPKLDLFETIVLT